MARHLPVVVAINKIDRGDARPPRSSMPSTSCSWISAPTTHQIEFPIVYTNAKLGTATLDLDEPGTDLRPLLDLLVEVTPPLTYTPGHPLQLLVTNLSANDYVGRMAVGRIWNGTIRTGQRITVVREEADDTAGTVEPGRTVTLTGTVSGLQTAHGIERVDIEEAGPGEIVRVAGLPEVTIGDTLTEPADPRPLPRLDVDEPTLRMTFGVNTSPLAGREGKFSPPARSRHASRSEVLGNVSIEVRPTESPETSRSAGGASSNWRCSSSRCGARASRCRFRGPRCSCARSTAGYRSRTSGSRSTSRPTTSGRSSRRSPAGRAAGADDDRRGRPRRMEFVLPVRGLIGYRGQL